MTLIWQTKLIQYFKTASLLLSFVKNDYNKMIVIRLYLNRSRRNAHLNH